MGFRSLLFVPGARPDRFEKAVASGADAVCIDLEDAVAPQDKAAARAETLGFLAGDAPRAAAVGFRINPLSSIEGFRDLAAFAESGARPDFLMIPKAGGATEAALIAEAFAAQTPALSLPLWPLIEDPKALAAAPGVAAAAAATGGGVMFGGADYSASIGAGMGWDALYMARAGIVAAAASAGAPAIDVPYIDVKDMDGMRAETGRVKAMGFSGRACIHPAQVEAINRIFTPSDAELDKAARSAAAYEEAAGGVALLDGKLVEKPVLMAAQRVLAARRD